MEHRAKFDFVVHFTNGGSLSAADFRLDIPGDDISDDELAAYLIQDMHLLMAGRVEISNKVIIEEAHKRAPICTHGLPTRTVDLAVSAPALDELLRLADEGAIRMIAGSGESYSLSRLVR